MKSITSKLQITVSSIGFIKKLLHHNLVTTFAKVEGQFINSKDKTRVEESIFKSNLVEHKRNIQILSKNHENFVEQLKHRYGVILFRMLYLNILAVLRKSDLEQLKRKNNKLRILSLKVFKNRDSYQVPVINLSYQVLDTKPLKYGLHHSFTDKNKFVKRNEIKIKIKNKFSKFLFAIMLSNSIKKPSMNIFVHAQI